MADVTDEEIRKMAKERVAFKQHLGAYLIINAMLIGIWALTGGADGEFQWSGFWPVWTLLFWGMGLAFHAVNVYSGGGSMLAKEEAKLRQKYR